jgi:hypothetical protein
MAYTNERPKLLTSRGIRPSMAAKIGSALLVCATVRVLLAQAPPAPTGPAPAVAEDTDTRGYKVQIPPEIYTDPKNRGKLQTLKNTQIRGLVTAQPSTVNDPATKASLDRFFQQYFFPVMTTEEGLKTIADDRKYFLTQYAQAAKDSAAHSYLINVAFTCASKIVQDNYHPASRYNAMLLISSLNDQESNTQGVQTVAEPMQAALPFILQQFQKADNPDLVKLAALLGLSRHLELDNYRPPASAMPGARKTVIVKELTALVDAKEAPEGRTPEAHTWMRRRAIEALGMACITKPDPGIATTLDTLLKDETEPLSVRFTVASLLGKIALQAPAKIDPVPTAKELGYLALFACDAELTRAENFRKTDAEHEARLAGTYSGEIGYGGEGGTMPGPGMRPGMPGGMGDGTGGIRPLRPQPTMPGSAEGGFGGGYGETGYTDPSMLDPKHYRLEYLRRRIRQQLYAVQLGLTGGEDRVPPKRGTTPISADKTAKTERSVPTKGMWAIAKPGPERDAVDEVYYKVRSLIEVLEGAGPEAEFHQLVKDMRREMRNLEGITRRLPPPGAATGVAAAASDDEPATPAAVAKAKANKAAPGKAPAAKVPAPLPGKRPPATKTTPPARPQPTVFGQPRTSR